MNDLNKQRCYIHMYRSILPKEQESVDKATKDLKVIEKLEKTYLDYQETLYEKYDLGEEPTNEEIRELVRLGFEMSRFKCFDA